MKRRFQKRVESFACLNCGLEVSGRGFTNHCPGCLWSRHVDVFPGDRGEACQGMMEPVGLQKGRHGYVLLHRCCKCGVIRKNKVASDDSYDSLLKLAAGGEAGK